MLLPTFLSTLLDSSGAPLARGALEGKRVGLYFAAGWCPMCTSFEPALLEFRADAAKAGTPLELVLVSSDSSAAEQARRARALGMTQVGYEGPTREQLKRKYRVWPGREVAALGRDRRAGVPAIVVLGKGAESEVAFLDAESRGADALREWPLGEGVW